MDVKKTIEFVAKNSFEGFDPKTDMERDLGELGLDSLDKFGFIADVEDVCKVSIPRRLENKLKSVSDVVVSVENLKRVKKVADAWVPCALNVKCRCSYMSNAREDSMFRSGIAPNVDFCKAIACNLYIEKQR